MIYSLVYFPLQFYQTYVFRVFYKTYDVRTNQEPERSPGQKNKTKKNPEKKIKA